MIFRRVNGGELEVALKLEDALHYDEPPALRLGARLPPTP